MKNFVQVPKDLNDIKEKFMFGLTKRQVISFGIGFLIGVPMFFLTRGALGLSGGIFAMGACAAPAIICGIYRKNGMFFETVLKQMIKYFKSPRKRVYCSTNAYECIERAIEYENLKKALSQVEGGIHGKK